MNDWSCCNPAGKCDRGQGCPAGGACHAMPGCQDSHCPGHPGGARVARIKQRYPSHAPLVASASRTYIKHLARVMLLFFAVAIFCAAVVAAIPTGPVKPPSNCPKLMKMWGGNPPVHVIVKCQNTMKANS